jgi:predicted acylesterase/phospholipase RssA/CRP-like cAMP-binding protein
VSAPPADLLVEALARHGIDGLEVVCCGPGDVLLRRGDLGEDAFWVQAGTFMVTGAGDTVVGEVGPGALVGEFAALTGSPRSATVTALEPSTVRRVPRDLLDHLLGTDIALCSQVRAEAVRRVRTTRLRDAVAGILGPGRAHLVDRLADRAQLRVLEAGESVVAAGEPADGVMLVVSGRLRRLGPTEHVAHLGPGSVLGQQGLATGGTHPEMVEAVRDSVVASIPTEALLDLLAEEPRAVAPVLLSLAAGGDGGRRVVDRSVVLAVTAPAGKGLVDGVCAGLGTLGGLTRLSSASVDGVLGRPGIAQSQPGDPGEVRLLDFLARVEHDSRYLLLEPDLEDTLWTRRVLRGCDVIAVACSPEPDEREAGRVSALLDGAWPRTLRVLVLLQEDTTGRPAGAAEALARWSPDHLVHVRTGCPADVARLARLLGGRPSALVLGGGGGKAMASLGVYRAMAELGIPVDVVGGTSMGSIVGAAVAQGLHPDALLDAAERLMGDLLDYTIPVVSLLKGERASRAIVTQFGGWQVEDLWLPYFCVSTNLTRGRQEVHRRGELPIALRASIALPGAFPPVPVGEDLLVDGGVTNNLPVDVLRRLYPTAEVVAVEGAPATGPRAKADFGLSVSGWQALRASVGHSKTYPGVMAVIMRSMITGSMHQRDAVVDSGAIDLLVDMDLRGVGLLDFHRVRDVARLGYEQSMPRLEQWLESRATAAEADADASGQQVG